MNKTSLIVFSLLTASVCANAKSWIDVTDTYVKNPRYDNNSYSYWLGTGLSGASPKENAEHYQKTYNTYQTISNLPAGQYRVSLDAFYRMGSSDNDYNLYKSGNYADSQYAKLYATSSVGDYEVSIAPASSGSVTTSLGGAASMLGGWWSADGGFIPNNMEAAYYWFEAGYYDNTVECKVGDDGVLTIGIRKDQTLSGDWTCIDNWKLEYYGDVKNVESVTLNYSRLDMDLNETIKMEAYVTPADATYHTVTWTIQNTKVATVDADGKVTAVGIGTTTLIATATDSGKATISIPVKVTKNTPSASNIVINEIMAANVDVYLDPNQNYGGWVELYNPSTRGISLGNLYVSDDVNNLKKNKLTSDYGSIPAGGFAILNFGHHEVWTEMSYRQIDDELDCDGGTIIISDGTNIIAQQDYPSSISRVSYARTTDGGDSWGNSGNPTPGTTNANGEFAAEQIDAPTVDKDAQLFSGSMQVCVNIPDGATLKYTTDGSAPSQTNGEVSATGLFDVSGTTTYRFRLFKDGYLPSKVITRSYIEDNGNYPFPIISIVTDNSNIYGDNQGAFKQGPYGRPGNGQTSNCNWNMDWDHPVNFEYINTKNECKVSQECNFAMCGGWSRAWTPHSFKLKANKTYDLENAFNYQFFDEKPNIKHKTLQIRNGGNDTSCRIIDPAMQRIIASSGLYIDYQAWQPVHVFLNGQHYAVLNMREPNNKHHAYSNYGLDSDEMDQFEMSPDSGYVQMEGTPDAYEKWYELSANAADDATYQEICKLVDIDEYTNYMACEFYAGGTDWPQNNVKGYRDINDGKFHFVLFDIDFAFNTSTPFQTFLNKQNYTFDTLHGYDWSQGASVEGQHKSAEIKFVTIFVNMLNNEDFRKRFIDAYCIVNGSVFTPSRVKDIVNTMSSYLGTGGYVNPTSSANKLISSLSTSRQTSMINEMKNFSPMQLSSATGQTAKIYSNISEGKIFMNGQVIPTGTLEGTVFAPVTLKAVAPAGYKFAGWTTESTKNSTTVFDFGSDWKYNDFEDLDAESWESSYYTDTKWKSGNAPVGYGNNDHVTTVTSNCISYYLRKTFKLTTEPKTNDEFILDFKVDDGAVIYVNGKEASRYNMPTGTDGYNTVASTYAAGNPDASSITLDASLFKKGDNVIAVSLHNNQASSSDIYWDACLTLNSESEANNNYVSTDPEYTCPAKGSINLKAVWEEKTEEEMIADGLNTSPVIINEISAANTIYVNDHCKKNDWVELYNTTSNDIDIAGMYVSDNTQKPTKYQVPTNDISVNTIIPAYGYKLVWCDKQENISDAIHASFKLDADGGDVMIAMGNKNATADDIAQGKNIAYSDTMTYCVHTGMQSFGCYPDGGALTYILDKPTPGQANIYTAYAVEYTAPAPEPDAPDAIAIVREGGMSIAYVEGVVNVKSEDYDITSVNVYSVSGAKMAADVTRNTGSFATINVSSLHKGIYVAVATNADGDACKVKFVIR